MYTNVLPIDRESAKCESITMPNSMQIQLWRNTLFFRESLSMAWLKVFSCSGRYALFVFLLIDRWDIAGISLEHRWRSSNVSFNRFNWIIYLRYRFLLFCYKKFNTTTTTMTSIKKSRVVVSLISLMTICECIIRRHYCLFVLSMPMPMERFLGNFWLTNIIIWNSVVQ